METSAEQATIENDKNLLPQLPRLTKRDGQGFFDKFASLNIETYIKDNIYKWWGTNDTVQADIQELGKVAESASLPQNEASYVSKIYESRLRLAKQINQEILDFLSDKPNMIRRIINLYASSIGTSSQETSASIIAEHITPFWLLDEKANLAVAIGKSIIETRESNPDEKLIRKKVAQYAFQEIFDQLSYARLIRKKDMDAEVSGVIDSPEEERIDLKSCLLGNPWAGEERKKMLRNYNKLRRVMDKLETDRETKVDFNTLWKWANGKIPQNSSVFNILGKAHSLDIEITNDLIGVWDVEAEREEDDQEPEDE